MRQKSYIECMAFRVETKMHGTFLKSIFIWQHTAKLRYSPSCTDQTTSSNIMIDNLKTPLKMFYYILQELLIFSEQM